MVNDDIDDFCPDDLGCADDLTQVADACEFDPSVVDYETFVTCIDANISDDCHDCVCDLLANQGTPCPEAFSVKKWGRRQAKAIRHVQKPAVKGKLNNNSVSSSKELTGLKLILLCSLPKNASQKIQS